VAANLSQTSLRALGC